MQKTEYDMRISDWSAYVCSSDLRGDEALQVRRRLDVDVVVLDHRMPGLTGLETATAMLAEAPDLPIVLYSAFTDERMAAEARSIGIRECVAKGDAPRLISVLRGLIGPGSS